MLTKDQATAVADQLIKDAESKREKIALARLSLLAGKPPSGVSTKRFKQLVDEAERHVRVSWKLLCPLGVAIVIFGILYYVHAAQVMIGFSTCTAVLLTALRRRLVKAYIRDAACIDLQCPSEQ